MKSKRQISGIKHFAGAFLIHHKFDRRETSSYLLTSVISLSEQDYENKKKMVITNF